MASVPDDSIAMEQEDEEEEDDEDEEEVEEDASDEEQREGIAPAEAFAQPNDGFEDDDEYCV